MGIYIITLYHFDKLERLVGLKPVFEELICTFQTGSVVQVTGQGQDL